jgi:SAM-dependent methyltransferase
MDEFEGFNRTLWNELTPVHINSYPVDEFKNGESTLDPIQLSEVGVVRGKSLLHLQCHFGLDTLSWTREGAAATGVDFSERSIAFANKLKEEVGLQATFICANLYDLCQLLNERFDVVYTSKGVLCWLRDLRAWAQLISDSLKPGGIFYMMEIHPILSTLDDGKRQEMKIVYNYFHEATPTKWNGGSPDYSDETYIVENPSYEWQWSLGDVINSLSEAGLRIEFLHEFDRTFYKALPGMRRDDKGWWFLPGYRKKIPLMFTLRAVSED